MTFKICKILFFWLLKNIYLELFAYLCIIK